MSLPSGFIVNRLKSVRQQWAKLLVNAIRRPSGDHSGAPPSSLGGVTARAWLPSARVTTTRTTNPAVEYRAKAILPVDETDAWRSASGARKGVRARSWVPPPRIFRIAHGSPAGRHRVKTIRRALGV